MRRIPFLALVVTLSGSVLAPGVAQAQSPLAGRIVFGHEESGSSDLASKFCNLRILDAGAPAQQTALTRVSRPPIYVGAPAWSRDRRQVAFVSNINALGSFDTQSVFLLNADGANARQVTGFGSLKPHTGPTGTVRGRVVVPDIQIGNGTIQGSVRTCFVTAQGSTTSAACDDGGNFVLQNVPVGSTFVRVQGTAVYPNPVPSVTDVFLGFATIAVRAGETTDAGTITISPTKTTAVEVSWSPDGRRLAVTHEVRSQTIQIDADGVLKWKGMGSGQLSLWSTTGDLLNKVSLPGLPQYELYSADWSPEGDRLVCGATSVLEESCVALIRPDGSNPQRIYRAPKGDPFAPIQIVRQCRWSPDGRRIAFTQFSVDLNTMAAWSDLFVMNVDGAGLRQMTFARPSQHVTSPAWSPDGQFLAFDVQISPDLLVTVQSTDLYAIRADGTGLTRLTNDGRSYSPAW
jgi:Tol biopolymer transport system component